MGGEELAPNPQPRIWRGFGGCTRVWGLCQGLEGVLGL